MKKALIIFISFLIPFIGVYACAIKKNQIVKIEDFGRQFLSILETGNVNLVKENSTDKGFKSLVVGQKQNEYSTWFISIGKEWKGKKMKWERISEQEAKLTIGDMDEENSIYPSSLIFIKTSKGWKFDLLLSAK